MWPIKMDLVPHMHIVDITTHPEELLSSDVSQSIEVNKCEASMFAYHSMIYRK